MLHHGPIEDHVQVHDRRARRVRAMPSRSTLRSSGQQIRRLRRGAPRGSPRPPPATRRRTRTAGRSPLASIASIACRTQDACVGLAQHLARPDRRAPHAAGRSPNPRRAASARSRKPVWNTFVASASEASRAGRFSVGRTSRSQKPSIAASDSPCSASQSPKRRASSAGSARSSFAIRCAVSARADARAQRQVVEAQQARRQMRGTRQRVAADPRGSAAGRCDRHGEPRLQRHAVARCRRASGSPGTPCSSAGRRAGRCRSRERRASSTRWRRRDAAALRAASPARRRPRRRSRPAGRRARRPRRRRAPALIRAPGRCATGLRSRGARCRDGARAAHRSLGSKCARSSASAAAYPPAA